MLFRLFPALGLVVALSSVAQAEDVGGYGTTYYRDLPQNPYYETSQVSAPAPVIPATPQLIVQRSEPAPRRFHYTASYEYTPAKHSARKAVSVKRSKKIKD